MHQMYHHFISRLVRDGSQPFWIESRSESNQP
jgi:hypothetical protein